MTISSILGSGQTALLKGLEKTTKDMDVIQTTMGTGRKNNSYGELGGVADVFSTAESRHGLAVSEGDKVLLTQPILKSSASLANTLRRLAEQGANITQQVVNGGLPGFDVAAQGLNYLNSAIDTMNVKINGLSITSGSRSDKLAWDRNNLQNPATYTFTAADDVAMPQGYNGDSNRLTFTINGQKQEITFTGNELGPQRLVRAFHIMATADPNSPNYLTQMTEATRLFGQAKDGMRNIESQLGMTSQQIDNGQKSAKLVEFEQLDMMQGINGTNTLETIPVLMALSTQQQAGFSVLGKDTELTQMLLGILNKN